MARCFRLLAGIVAATAPALAEPTPLHCCFASAADPLLLSCEAEAGSVVSDIPFAVKVSGTPVPPWNPRSRHPVCGDDAAPAGASVTADLTDQFRRDCVGKASCVVGVPSPYFGGSEEVLVRWTCAHDAAPRTAAAAVLPALPLRVQGATIVDATGARFRLQGVNWAGAHIIGVPSGLDRAPLDDLAQLVKRLDFNVVRLPYSVDLVLRNPVVDDILVAANPKLRGLKALEVMDQVVDALARAGVLVWPDVHMLESDWCCEHTDCNGLWFNEAYSMDQWLEALRIVATRYANVPAVAGIGLKNELRAVCGGQSWGSGPYCDVTFFDASATADACVGPAWNTGPEYLQVKIAAEAAGATVLMAAPHKLVSIGGLAYSTDLRNVPIDLPKESFVYEAHEYSWSSWSVAEVGDLLGAELAAGDLTIMSQDIAQTHCLALGSKCAGLVCSADGLRCTARAETNARRADFVPRQVSTFLTYRNRNPNFEHHLDEHWGYLVKEGIAPVWVSEFGFDHDEAQSSNEWLMRFSNYVSSTKPHGQADGFDWAYWELSGDEVGGTSRTAGAMETFGVLGICYTGAASAAHHQAIRAFSGDGTILTSNATATMLVEDLGARLPRPAASAPLLLPGCALAAAALLAGVAARRSRPRRDGLIALVEAPAPGADD